MFDYLKESYQILRKKSGLWMLSTFISLLMLILLFSLTFYTSLNMLENVKQIKELMEGEEINQLGDIGSDSKALSSFMKMQMEFKNYYDRILELVVMFFALLFCILFVGGSINWYITYRTNEVIRKYRRFLPYIGSFLVASVVWYLLFMLLIYIFVKTSVSRITANITLLSAFSISLIFVIIALIMLYFMFISLSLVQDYSFGELFVRTFDIGAGGIKKLLLMYLVIIVIYLIILLFGFVLYQLNVLLSIIPVIVLLPLFALMRTFMFRIVNSLG